MIPVVSTHGFLAIDTMIRAAVIPASLGLCVIGGSSLHGDNHSYDLPHALLGVRPSIAFQHIRSRDSGALIGEVCRGRPGITASFKYDGIDWRVFAHIERGAIVDLLLINERPAGSNSRHACSAAHHAAVEKLTRRHPDWTWKLERGLYGENGMNVVVTGSLTGGTTLTVQADRPDGEAPLANCR
jgi:hypothetical protein